MSAIHVAIVDRLTAEKLLAGPKRVESRFGKRRCYPHGRVSRGDKIYFKVSGSAIIGHGRVTRVQEFHDLTPTAIDALRKRYNHAVLAPPAYWQARRLCRFGVLIWLTRFTPQSPAIPVPRQYGAGWVVLPDRTPRP